MAVTSYNLAGLSSDSFEHLIQALFLKVVGPGGIVFGAGPDGAREATFEGKMDYPSRSRPWRGYLVVQAKFLENSFGTPKKDGEWLLDRLQEELTKFKDEKRRLRKPDYYLLCSNVRLTSAWKTGVKDRIYAAFKDAGVYLKDYRIWDYDQINRLLDNAPEICKQYACWIQPGYVLSRVIDWIGGLQVNFEKAIVGYLQKQLVRDHYLRLDQSGVSGGIDARIPVERVFIDLSASQQEGASPEPEKPDAELPPGFVAQLLASGAKKCDIGTIRRRRERQEDNCAGRVVLVGGPGQGKTTISQYVCQLHRAALLRDRRESLDVQVANVIDAVETQSRDEGISMPTGRRYPVRIELSDFAKAIAPESSDRVDSVLAYLARNIRSVSGHEVEVESLRTWLANYPWLLVLDGLDEVPGSANRIEVVRLVNELLIDIANENGDVLVMVTTRPQGYKNDFPHEQFGHWYLTPLSISRALHCARRFAAVHMGEADQDKVMKELANAAKAEETARLMRSPLQVTIMATLAQSGSIPDDRWRLFSEYYRIIYEREVAKRHWKVLETNREDIHVIHDRAALLLQIECERTGRTDARLTASGLERIVTARLGEHSLASADLARLTREILKAASDRLVFLVGLEADRVGFEIRSLQEFMAARALLHGREQSVIERLQHVAPIPHWRNTFVFAAANCFTEREWLGDTITGICARLNEPVNDPVGARALAGSQLALDLAEAGVASRQPKFRAVLSGIASKVLRRPPSDMQERLASLSGFEEALEQEIRERLQREVAWAGLGAWLALLALIRRGSSGAVSLAESFWPETEEQQTVIIRLGGQQPAHPWLIEKLTKSLARAPFGEVNWLLEYPGFDELPPDSWVPAFVNALRGRGPSLRLKLNEIPGLTFTIQEQDNEAWRQIDASSVEDTCSRAFLDAVKRFASGPSTGGLADALSAAVPLLTSVRSWSSPWPIGTVVRSCDGASALLEQSARARAGELGEPEDWAAAEVRWRGGLELADFAAFLQHDGLPGGYLRNRGVPFTSGDHHSAGEGDHSRIFSMLADPLPNLQSVALREQVARFVQFLASSGRIGSVGADTMIKVVEYANSGWFDFSRATDYLPQQEERLRFYELLGALVNRGYWVHRSPSDEGQLVVSELLRNPSRTALLPIIFSLSSRDHCLGHSPAPVAIPLAIIRQIAPKDLYQRAALAKIAAGHPDLDGDTASWVSSVLCETATEDDYSIVEALNDARARVLRETALAQLALSLLDRLPAEKWRARAAAYDVLDDILRRRKSDLRSLPGTAHEEWLLEIPGC